MGNSATTPGEYDDGGDPNLDEFDGIESLGYRVLGVQPNSPASAAGLVSFFDFIVGANGERLLATGEGLEEGEEYDDIDFPALLMEHKGKAVELRKLFVAVMLLRCMTNFFSEIASRRDSFRTLRKFDIFSTLT